MPIPIEALSSFARDFAKDMTSIRGRRVQRLLKREFAGASHVWQLESHVGAAVLGLSSDGAALCATDGTGPVASVVAWRHGSAEGVQTDFDLHKDSLPILRRRAVQLAGLCASARLSATAGAEAREPRRLAEDALRALA